MIERPTHRPLARRLGQASAALLAISALVSACGVKGELTPAAPLWGNAERATVTAPELAEDTRELTPLVFEEDFEPVAAPAPPAPSTPEDAGSEADAGAQADAP